MADRKPSPSILVIGGLVALVGMILILTGNVDYAAIVGGFVPLRVGWDPTLLDGASPLVPVWLTPLSAAFIHDGWLHLGLNLLMLLIVGTPIQHAVGRRGLIVLLLVGAYAAVAAEWAAAPGSAMPMIGASGAISALIGAYALMFGGRRAKAIGPVPARVVHALSLAVTWAVLNFAIGWASAGSDMPIAGAAHVGGFLAGMLLLHPLLAWRWARRGG